MARGDPLASLGVSGGFAFLCLFMRLPFGSSWYAEMACLHAGTLCIVLSVSVAGVLKKQRAIKQGVARLPWHRVSLLELFVIMTGVAANAAIHGAHYRSIVATDAAVQSLQSQAADLLGPDGHVYRNSDGIHVSLCDRTFDDYRLVEFTRLADELGVLDRITSLLIGSNAKNINTPAVWPNLTESSVESLLAWRSVERLTLRGAALTQDSVARLADLPRLRQIQVTTPIDEPTRKRILSKRADLRVRAGEDWFGGE